MSDGRHDLILILRLYHDVRDGRRTDRDVAVDHLAKLVETTTEIVERTMVEFSSLDPRSNKRRSMAAPPTETEIVWSELGGDRVRTRRRAEESESVLWRQHGQRMGFDIWKAELVRISGHEGGGRRATIAAAGAAFELGSSPWEFYKKHMDQVESGSLDDIPVLGEDD